MADDPKSYKFIKEIIKDDGSKKPFWVRLLVFVLAAIIFGLIASLVIALTEPRFSSMVRTENETGKVDIPKDENPEDNNGDGENGAAVNSSSSSSDSSTSASSSDSTSSSSSSASSSEGSSGSSASDKSTSSSDSGISVGANSSSVSTDSSDGSSSGTTGIQNGVTDAGDDTSQVEDHRELYRTIFMAADSPKHALVTVTGIKSQMDYFKQNYESQQQLSGLLVADNGTDLFILTEYRVVADVERIQVTMYDGSIVDATFQKQDKNTGLAILKVPRANLDAATRDGIVVAPFGNSYSLKQGEPVLAVGNPNGYSDSISYGVITSVTNKVQTVDNEFNLITTDIIGSREGSGVLVNLDGEIVGVIAQSFGSDDNNIIVSFSISQIKSLIEQLSNNEQLSYIGIRGNNVTTEIADKTGIPQGVLITSIEADSPAMLSGMKESDVIVKFDGDKVSTLTQYRDKLDKCEIGAKIPVIAMRKGAEGYVEVKFEVTIAER